jgi:basic membrane protein A
MNPIRADSHRKKFPWFALTAIGILITITTLLFVGYSQTQASNLHSIKVGLIVSETGVGDLSFNWMANEGLERAETDFGVDGTVYTPTGPEDYSTQIQLCVSEGCALCVAVGWGFTDAITTAAAANPVVDFAIVDVSYSSYPDNLRGLVFDSAQVGYLAGTLAGLMTESDIVGGVGGMEIGPVVAFLDPYRYAAQCINPDLDAIITYTGTFTDPDLGSQVAQDQLDAGADVIFAVAGPTGNGALLTTTQAGAWAIGVDNDQWYTVFDSGAVDGSEYLLTSAMKRVDNAVYNTIEDEVGGVFTSGTMVYDLAADGVGLAPYHEADASIPQSVKDQVESVKQDILDGIIDVWQPCMNQFIFLPLITQ